MKILASSFFSGKLSFIKVDKMRYTWIKQSITVDCDRQRSYIKKIKRNRRPLLDGPDLCRLFSFNYPNRSYLATGGMYHS